MPSTPPPLPDTLGLTSALSKPNQFASLIQIILTLPPLPSVHQVVVSRLEDPPPTIFEVGSFSNTLPVYAISNALIILVPITLPLR